MAYTSVGLVMTAFVAATIAPSIFVTVSKASATTCCYILRRPPLSGTRCRQQFITCNTNITIAPIAIMLVPSNCSKSFDCSRAPHVCWSVCCAAVVVVAATAAVDDDGGGDCGHDDDDDDCDGGEDDDSDDGDGGDDDGDGAAADVDDNDDGDL